LKQSFGRRNGTFSRNDYTDMQEYIFDSLPTRKELGLSPDTTLVGVGGTLRAMARYDQQLREYELDKVHNYRLDYQSAASISQELDAMDADELSEVKAIGNNRIDTVTAGSAIITTLMKKLDFEKVVVSAEGLREGILSVFVRDSKMFYRGSINSEKAKTFVTFSCQVEMLPQCTMTLIRPLTAAGLLREKEKMILTHAIKQAAQLPPVTNLNNLFYMMMDEDNAFLSHREQLILALSIVHTKKEKAADWLFSRYTSILEPQNKQSIEKISACLVLSGILEKAKASTKLTIRGRNTEMKIFVLPRQFIPLILLKNAIKSFERAFDVSIVRSIESANQAISKEKIVA
jgi:exopolyphosphatase/guanosine-5'-triphosphate,3'-diphosphate pyrophosphatase